MVLSISRLFFFLDIFDSKRWLGSFNVSFSLILLFLSTINKPDAPRGPRPRPPGAQTCKHGRRGRWHQIPCQIRNPKLLEKSVLISLLLYHRHHHHHIPVILFPCPPQSTRGMDLPAASSFVILCQCHPAAADSFGELRKQKNIARLLVALALALSPSRFSRSNLVDRASNHRIREREAAD